MFDGRLLSLPADQLTTYVNAPSLPAMPEARIHQLLHKLYDAGLRDWIEAHHKRREEQETLAAIESGKMRVKGNRFEYRGQNYQKSEAKRLLEALKQELEIDATALEEFDREVFEVHLRMAQIVAKVIEIFMDATISTCTFRRRFEQPEWNRSSPWPIPVCFLETGRAIKKRGSLSPVYAF